MIIRHIFLRRIVAISLIATVTLIYFASVDHHIISKVYYLVNPKKGIDCYEDTASPSLPDISDTMVRKGKSIFFHETSCNSFFNGRLFIYARQACAVESAARLHPENDVFLLFTSPGVFRSDSENQSDRILQALMSYRNVHLRHINFEKYSEGTPVEGLYKNREIQGSRYAQSHSSDVLRYLTLWKYGGIYLDLDVIVLKSLSELSENFAGSESDQNVAAGVLGLGPSGKGHDWAEMCLNDLRDNFNGRAWGYNGPGVITRLLSKICKQKYAKNMRKCDGFKVYPPETFYPIRWQNWKMYFEENQLEQVMNISKSSYAIHVWNKHSVSTKIPIGSRAAYAVFAQEYCPLVFRECSESF